jgi:glycosyltransferase 2 family protein
MERKWLVRLARVLGVLVVAACIYFIVAILVRDWPTTRSALENAQPGWMAAGAACAVTAMLWMAERWRATIIAVGGPRTNRYWVMGAFYLGESGKYLPGGIWSAVGRGELVQREGYARSMAYSSVVLSLVACYVAAAGTAVVLAVLALFSGHVDRRWWPVLLVAVGGLAMLHPAVNQRILNPLHRITRRRLVIELPDFRTCLRLTATYVPVWLAIAAAGICVTVSVDPGAPVLRVGLATVAAWVIGFVTPSPGGIGVREALFVATAGIPDGTAAAVAIVCRLLYVVIDATGAVYGSTALRAGRPTNEVTPPSEEPAGLGPMDGT